MFHAAACLGFQPVVLLLLLRQRMASVTLLAYPVLHLILFQRFLLTHIRAVRIQFLTLVLFVQQVVKRLGVVRFRRCRLLTDYQLAFGVTFDVVLVAEIVNATFLCPTGVRVLLAFLVWFVVPKVVTFIILDLLVLIRCVVLARCQYETRVNHSALIEYQMLLVQEVNKFLERDEAAIYNINVYGVRQATVSISHTKLHHKRKYVL